MKRRGHGLDHTQTFRVVTERWHCYPDFLGPQPDLGDPEGDHRSTMVQ
ncbi:hypothetical protein ACRAWD_24705 [Caulobacter segnis]